MTKRCLDIVLSLIGLISTGWLIVFFWSLMTLWINQNGIYTQKRIGQYGKPFTIYKLRTLFSDKYKNSFISEVGKFLRKSKIDELPQFWNVLIGDMSIVGPRPDIPGYYDKLEGEYKKILQLKPGITGPASLKYRDEEQILANKEDPEKYNNEVIFPDKVAINMEYMNKQTVWLDIKIILRTLF